MDVAGAATELYLRSIQKDEEGIIQLLLYATRPSGKSGERSIFVASHALAVLWQPGDRDAMRLEAENPVEEAENLVELLPHFKMR
jgi:hypothetical protein